MVNYATNFGNGSGSTFKIFGNEAFMDLADWNKPKLLKEGTYGAKKKRVKPEPIADVKRPGHMLDWLLD